jgi:hypothetical protein
MSVRQAVSRIPDNAQSNEMCSQITMLSRRLLPESCDPIGQGGAFVGADRDGGYQRRHGALRGCCHVNATR